MRALSKVFILLALAFIATRNAESKEVKEVILVVRDLDNHANYEFCAVQKHRSFSENSSQRPPNQKKLSCRIKFHSMIDMSSNEQNCNMQNDNKWTKITRRFDAVHIRLDDFNKCSINRIVRKLRTNTTNIVLVGTLNKNLHLDFNYTEKYASLFILPDEYSQEIKKLSSKTNNLAVKVYEPNLFDHSYVVLWILAIFIVFIGAIWNKNEFWKTYQKLSIRTESQLTEAVELREMTTEKKFELRVFVNKPFFRQNTESNEFLDKDLSIAADFEKVAEKVEEIKVEKEVDQKVQPTTNELKTEQTNKPNSLEEKCKRFLNAFEDTIGFDTIFVFYLLWFAILVELIHFKLFPIEEVRSIFGLISTIALYFCIHAFVEMIFYIRPKYPYITKMPIWVKVLVALTSSFLPIYYISLPISSSEWYFQNLLVILICLSVVGVVKVQRFINVIIIASCGWFVIAYFQFVSPSYNDGISFTDSALSEIDSFTLQRTMTQSEDNLMLPGMIWLPVMSYPRILCQVINPNMYSFMSAIDIVLPGFFVTYAITFDSAKADKKFFYFSVNMITYALILIISSYIFAIFKITNSTVIVTIPSLISLNILISYLNQEFNDYMRGKTIKDFWKNTVSDVAKEVGEKSKKVSNVVVIS